ncbi:MAG: aminotransferase class I/II-fold pyridoxal phosphate-dependent enzyme [Bacteroidetes bacterium]|nr:aminotransferase class I/II-fold pyridoxal phosphate-dependent enzyme [Bacteroidota bacterium]
MLEGHGDDAWKYGLPIRGNFSSNVWYGGLDEGLREHLCARLGSVTHYPEVDGRTVRGLAAAAFGVLPEQVLVTNGATEAIYLVAQLFAGRSATVLAPAFAEYEDACRMHGMQVRIGAWPGKAGEGFGTDLVFICNPNNPTGCALALDDLLRMIRAEPGVLFVVDESYIEFTASSATVLRELPVNVLVLRSLTKSCRIPGLRVGFVVGQAEQVRRLQRLKMPWSVNQLALEAAEYIFRHPDRFVVPLERLLGETAVFRSQLRGATGWKVRDSDTHYFLVEAPEAFTAGQLKEGLVQEWGLLIRDASNFRGLSPRHFRIACQAPGDNQLLIEALRQCSRSGQ